MGGCRPRRAGLAVTGRGYETDAQGEGTPQGAGAYGSAGSSGSRSVAGALPIFFEQRLRVSRARGFEGDVGKHRQPGLADDGLGLRYGFRPWVQGHGSNHAARNARLQPRRDRGPARTPRPGPARYRLQPHPAPRRAHAFYAGVGGLPGWVEVMQDIAIELIGSVR